MKRFNLLVLGCIVAGWPLAGAAQQEESEEEILARYGKRDARVHDPSTIVRCGEEYWLFSTGVGVRSWRSDDLEDWERGPRVFEEMPDWVTEVVPDQRGHFWAPDVIHLDGRYLLYYSVSSFGKRTSAIALATTPTLDPESADFGWKDEGIVVQTSEDDDYNAIDPAIILTESGELWMAFGSYWSGLKLVELDRETGKRIAPDAPLHPIAYNEDIEAAHIYAHEDWFYLFVNHGKCCRGEESTYEIRVGRSRDITGPYLDQDGRDLMDGGGTLLLETEGPFIGPGHASIYEEDGEYWFGCHYYDGTEGGRSRLSLRKLTWGADGWPEI